MDRQARAHGGGRGARPLGRYPHHHRDLGVEDLAGHVPHRHLQAPRGVELDDGGVHALLGGAVELAPSDPLRQLGRRRMARGAGANRESDLSWFDGSGTSDISPDGKLLLLSEFGEAGDKIVIEEKLSGQEVSVLALVACSGAGGSQGVTGDARVVCAIEFVAPAGFAPLETFEERYPDQLPELSPDARIAVYRVVQECLMNITKHSKAKSVLLMITAEAGQMSVLIRDDGVGIDEARMATPQSHGLLGMRHRIESLDGSMTIRSLGPGVGTECRFTLPLERILNTGTQ